MRRPRVRTIVLTLLLTLMAAAKKPAPLPDFGLTSLDSKTVRSDKLKLPNQWLLVYVQPHSSYSESVLNELKDQQQNTANQKVIIVVGAAKLADSQSMQDQFPHIKSATWYADTNREALQKMQITGVPCVLGMRNDTVQWQFIGTHPKPGHLKSMLKTWRDKK